MARISELPEKQAPALNDIVPLVDATSTETTYLTVRATIANLASAFVGRPNGAASLDATGKLPNDQFPVAPYIDGGNF